MAREKLTVHRKGKGKKVIKNDLKEGSLTKIAIKKGFIKEGQHVGHIPKSKIPEFARVVADYVGNRRAFAMFNVQVVFRKNSNDSFKEKMKLARDTISRERTWEGSKRKGKPGYKKKVVKIKHWKTGKIFEKTIWVKKK